LGVTRRAASVLGAAFGLPLLGYALIGSFARYAADDYCWAGRLRTEGFFGAQVLWYTGYSPRYAFTFLVNLVELAGPAIVPALPALAILVWLATLTWTFLQFKITSVYAFVLAEVTALTSLQTAPDMAQSLYWQTGMLTYLLPLVLATFLIGWIRRSLERNKLEVWTLGITMLVIFVAGGLSETYLIPQNVGVTLALLAGLVAAPRTRAQKVACAHLVAALAAGVLALLAILVAPATTYRVGGSPADIWLASSAAIATGVYQALRLLRFFPFTVLLCLGIPALLGVRPKTEAQGVSSGRTPFHGWPRGAATGMSAHFSAAPLGTGPGRINRRWFVLVSVAVAITIPFCYFPSFYAQNGNPPARSLIVPGALLVSYLLFAGYALRGFALRLPEQTRVAVALGLAVLQVGAAAVSFPEQASAAQQAAARWDAEDQQIRTSRDAGQADLTVYPLPPYLGENFVTSDRENWFNVCVARYYGVSSIAASEPAGAPPP
jgi:Family of unknown function (DUF6056)